MDTPIWRRPVFILICCVAMAIIAYGTRQSFGLFMRPLSIDMGWGREILSIAIATQNLIIGAGAPFAGALAARWGASRTIGSGAAIYALGLYLMSQSTSPETLVLNGGLIAGIGLSGCGIPLIAGVVGQSAPDHLRGSWLGTVTAAATAGQLLMLPFAQYLLDAHDWIFAIVVMSVFAGFIVPIAFGMSAASGAAERAAVRTQSIAEALREARGHRGFVLLTIGFFVCGFHVMFIGSHLPAYIVDHGGSAETGAMALMLIGLFNMIGSWAWGWLGDRYRKKFLLSILYLARSGFIALFVLTPVTPVSVGIFAAGVGLLWLGTLPLTSGIIVDVFGARYMAMLFGITFFSHQVGSFLGVWLGGRLYDATGSYDLVWWGGIALGVATALIHIPIDDKPLTRLAAAGA